MKRKVFGESFEDRLIIPKTWLALWAISTNIGLMAGALLAGWVQDRIGRRWTLTITSLICSVSVAICYISDLPQSIDARRGIFFLAKTVQGFAIGGIMTTTQTWLSEVLPTALRGPLMAVFPIFKLLGQLVGALISFTLIDSESRMAYRICFASQWPFSGLLTLLSFFLPESPAWLLRKGRDAAASSAMVRLRGSKGNNAQAAIDRLRGVVDAERISSVEKESYADCFKQPNLRRTFIVAFAEFVPLLFGLQLLGSASYFLQQIGLDPEISVLLQVIGIAVGVIASCVTFYTLSRFGRRVLMLLGLSAISLLWFGVGLSGIAQNEGAMWYVLDLATSWTQ
jgi:MFS family permease